MLMPKPITEKGKRVAGNHGSLWDRRRCFPWQVRKFLQWSEGITTRTGIWEQVQGRTKVVTGEVTNLSAPEQIPFLPQVFVLSIPSTFPTVFMSSFLTYLTSLCSNVKLCKRPSLTTSSNHSLLCSFLHSTVCVYTCIYLPSAFPL